MNKPKKETLTQMQHRLFQTLHEHFGVSEETARQVFRAAGYDKFDPKYWQNYFETVRLHIMNQALEREAQELARTMPNNCPVCGGDVERDNNMDRLFSHRQGVGWKCVDNPGHFIEHKINLLRKHLAEKPRRKIIVTDDCWRYETL